MLPRYEGGSAPSWRVLSTEAKVDITSTNMPQLKPADDGRALALFGVIAGIGLGFMVAIFWAMAAVLVFTNNGGLVTQLNLQGIWLVLFYSFPVVLVVFSGISIALFALRRELESVAVSMMPVGLVVLYYLALIYLH